MLLMLHRYFPKTLRHIGHIMDATCRILYVHHFVLQGGTSGLNFSAFCGCIVGSIRWKNDDPIPKW